VHVQCWWQDRVVVMGSQYKLLGLQDWKEDYGPRKSHVFLSFSVVL
jgi:hypothetical protein